MKLEFVEQVLEPAVSRITQASAGWNGVVDHDSLPTGRWRITASSRRHRSLVIGTFDTAPGTTLDLGRITLQPLPIHRGRLWDEYGQPLADCWISLPPGKSRADPIDPTVSDRDGAFELVGDLPRLVVMQVNAPGALRTLKAQRFVLDRWDEGTQQEIHLAAYQHVILEIYGTSALPGELQVYICPDVDSVEPDIHTFPDTGGHEPLLRGRELEAGGESRRFEFYASAGAYNIWGGSRSMQVASQLKLLPGTPECTFALRAH